jgi:uncharacterized protein YecE (DUF72 family)
MKVGCAGYPVGRDRYWRTLSFLEADTGKGLPREDTLRAWRADVPQGAETALQALRLITHGPEDRGFPACGRKLPKSRQLQCGAFRDSLEVYEAWLATKNAAETLGARIVVFESPGSFHPGPDRIRDLYAFFKRLNRGKLALVWHPPRVSTSEWDVLEDKVCLDLGLIRAFDPLRKRPPAKGAFLYMRPGLARMGTLSVDNLSTIVRASTEAPTYVALSHRNNFRDADRLQEHAGRPR